MLPQFFEMIGIDTSGLVFERVFWVLVLLAGILMSVREVSAHRPVADAWYGWAIGGLLALFGGYRLYRALFLSEVYFGVEGLKLSTYGVAIATSFVVTVYLASREAKRADSVPTVGHVLDLAFWILIMSMVGSRLLFIVASWRDYYNLCFAPELMPSSGGVQDCFALLKFWKGGLVFFGGFLGAIVAGLWYCRKKKLNFLRFADLVAPWLPLGHFFGRLGCLAAGCCYGRASTSSWAVEIHHHAGRLHPTQLYEATAELLFFIIILTMRPRKRFHGQLLATWLILYSVMRFVVEFFRGDTIRGYLFELAIRPVNRFIGIGDTDPTILTTSQTISIVTALVGVAIFVRYGRRSRRTAL